MQLIAARGYGAIVEHAILCHKVAKRSICRSRNGSDTLGREARDVHAVVIRDYEVQGLGGIIPRHAMYLAAIF